MRSFVLLWGLCASLLLGCQSGRGWRDTAPGVAAEKGLVNDGLAAASPAEPAFEASRWQDQPDTVGNQVVLGGQSGQSGLRGLTVAEPVRLLIQRGEMRLEVVRPEDSGRDFLAKVKAAGGYLLQQTGNTLTVRVPAAAFDETFLALRGMGRVLGESREANDVTEEFVDLGIRIDNARKARERLLEILQKAEKVEDILKVEAEVRRLTDDIERMEGRKKFLADQVAMATLTATFVAKVEPAAPPPPKRSRQISRFEWINEAGPESLLEGR